MPLEFTVALDGQEPNPVLVDDPTPGVLDSKLGAAGTATCGCQPRAQGHLALRGKTPATQQAAIEDAILDAVLKENPGDL